MIKKIIKKLNDHSIDVACRANVKHKVYESNQILIYECCNKGYSPFWVLFVKYDFLSYQKIKVEKFLYEKDDVMTVIEKYKKWPDYNGGFQKGELDNE